MPKKYHIHPKEAAPRFHPIGKYAAVEFREDCAGSCRKCVKKRCVYNIFKENALHASAMNEPEYLYKCQSCFRCIQECTRGIFSRVINPDYRTLGDDYWKPHIIHSLWYQSHLGKIPVSGAGYRGPFSGAGFDSMWTDMSEIVRPTRDGIHGREYINTCIELSSRTTPLKFNKDMQLDSETRSILEIPLPILLKAPNNLMRSRYINLSIAKAAKKLGTMFFIEPEDYTRELSDFAENIVPCLTKENYKSHEDKIKRSRAVEIGFENQLTDIFDDLRSINPEVVIMVSMPLDSQSAERVCILTQNKVDSIVFYANSDGNELNSGSPRFLKDMIREVHLKLVDNGIRQNVNLIFGGGIAMAEHIAKSIVCGADGIVADNALMIAMECRLCGRCEQGLSCPVELDKEFDAEWGCDRINNLIGSWHSQLLEMMGAMGIRETRRLRGEVGRSMWFEDLEKESFEPIFGKRRFAAV